MKRILTLGCSLLLVFVTAQASVELLEFDNPEQKSLYDELIDELRCLVCQNQNLKDSNADLAKDLRQQTYDMIRSGAGKQEVVNYMVARYGDFVLFRPPFRSTTMFLWIGPFFLMAVALAVLYLIIRRRGRAKADVFTDAKREQMKRLLEPEE